MARPKKKKVEDTPKIKLNLKDRVIVFDFGMKIKGTVVKKAKNHFWVRGDNNVNYPKLTIGPPKKNVYFYIIEKLDESEKQIDKKMVKKTSTKKTK